MPLQKWTKVLSGGLNPAMLNNLERRVGTGGLSVQTPGATSTVNIAHGFGVTPDAVSVMAADADARGAPSFYVTLDATNITLNFSANLTAATVYEWRWWVAKV